MDELGQVLHGISLVGECTARTRDSVLSCGERLSAQLVAAALRESGTPTEACDARSLIVTDGEFGNARVDFSATRKRVRDHFAGEDATQVVTGFIAADPSGDTTTLGRGGSDYTAAILGAALAVDRIEIWTDVDGVMSADPRLVPGAFSLPSLSYNELMELSHFGAKVVYPPTLHPARTHSIPIFIRNTFNPAFEGTRVIEQIRGNGHQVRGISSVNEVALLRLEGDGMVGVPGIAERLFGVLARRDISVILISQASSEHSICFAVDPGAVRRGAAPGGRRVRARARSRPHRSGGGGDRALGGRRGRRDHVPDSGHRRQGLQRARRQWDQRPGHRPGLLRTQHLVRCRQTRSGRRDRRRPRCVLTILLAAGRRGNLTMQLISTNGGDRPIAYRDALFESMTADGGLYTPGELTPISPSTVASFREADFGAISTTLARHLLGKEFDTDTLTRSSRPRWTFRFRSSSSRTAVHLLELFHGPTLAFKDVGARFMARTMRACHRTDERLTILVATSGDTGSAVADAFLGLANTRIVVLFPDGQVSDLQERQFTTLGENVRALAVQGTFDDCQKLAKTAFADDDLRRRIPLTSANSINIGRLLPQIFYYFGAWAQLPPSDRDLVFCTPSGNFGNLTAGLMAKRLGLPVDGFVAATNINDVVPEVPRRAGPTAPAHPSARSRTPWMWATRRTSTRIIHLYDGDLDAISA